MLSTPPPLDWNFPEMPPSKPSRSYIAKGIPHPQGAGGYGWIAQWAYPGMPPELLRDENGAVQLYRTKADADAAAAMGLVDKLNSRNRTIDPPKVRPEEGRAHGTRSPRDRYTKLTGEEFMTLLAEAGLDPGFFAYLYGTSPDRIVKWADGIDMVPHPVRILLEIFKEFPDAVDLAEDVTEEVSGSRHRVPEE